MENIFNYALILENQHALNYLLHTDQSIYLTICENWATAAVHKISSSE